MTLPEALERIAELELDVAEQTGKAETLDIAFDALVITKNSFKEVLERIVREGIDTSTDGGMRIVQEALDKGI